MFLRLPTSLASCFHCLQQHTVLSLIFILKDTIAKAAVYSILCVSPAKQSAGEPQPLVETANLAL